MPKTIAYDRSVQGWTSEYSFIPDAGVSLNNNFYTFNNGRIWIHNSTDVLKNTFYGGATIPTELVFLFNDDPTAVKNFKTIKYQGTGDWRTAIETNMETGVIEAVNFVDKEGKRVGYIRGTDTDNGTLDLKSTTVKGAGLFRNPNVSAGEGTFELAEIPSDLAVGDTVFRSTITGETGGNPEPVGRISAIDHSTNQITVQGGRTGIFSNIGLFFTPTTNDLMLYVKSNQVEKSGLIGFFAICTMTNNSGDDVELFGVDSEVFISSK